MSDFFKQLIAQISVIWQKLSLQQKIVMCALVGFILLGFTGLLIWARGGTQTESGYAVLYSNLTVEEAAEITEQLESKNYKYKLENNGQAIHVERKKLYEVRMALAREGLPRSQGLGYEIFDKTNFGVTDFVQKINARRALEGELQRTIEGLDEVNAARVHIVVPEPTIFLDKQKDAKASVVLKCRSGRTLSKTQIRGITHLVSSSVDGLKPQHISIVDYEGKLLSSPFGYDDEAIISSRNMELQQTIERYLENKADQILTGVLGPSKAHVKIAADLDFDRVEKTMEKYDPEKRVVRSEERIDESTKNAPDGDNMRERSLTNYEIDKTVQHIMQEIGNIKRLTISVAVDGRYETGENGKKTYVDRSPEDLQAVEDMVKNAVGYDLARGDQIAVSGVQFDNEFLRDQQEQFRDREVWEYRMTIAKYAVAAFIVILFILFLRYLAKTIAEAMNPPIPAIEQLGIDEEVDDEIPGEIQKNSELLEQVEMMTKEAPLNIAAIIRQWLGEPMASSKKNRKM